MTTPLSKVTPGTYTIAPQPTVTVGGHTCVIEEIGTSPGHEHTPVTVKYGNDQVSTLNFPFNYPITVPVITVADLPIGVLPKTFDFIVRIINTDHQVFRVIRHTDGATKLSVDVNGRKKGVTVDRNTPVTPLERGTHEPRPPREPTTPVITHRNGVTLPAVPVGLFHQTEG